MKIDYNENINIILHKVMLGVESYVGEIRYTFTSEGLILEKGNDTLVIKDFINKEVILDEVIFALQSKIMNHFPVLIND